MNIALKDFSLFDLSECALGVYDTYTKARIYNIFRQDQITDFHGFVDKDVEAIIANTTSTYNQE